VPKLEASERFLAAQELIPDHIYRKLEKALRFLAANPRHPSLQTKRLKGYEGIYEARVDQAYRFTYHRQPNDTLILRTVGRHDETLRNP
jgi:mRNA-degrading endonuclease RelE of RelBE toxin-antitoxin system